MTEARVCEQLAQSHYLTVAAASWQGVKGRGGNCPPPSNFSLSGYVFFVREFTSKILGWRSPTLGKFRDTIEILSTHNLPCRKFGAVCRKNCRKIANSCPFYLFNLRRPLDNGTAGCWTCDLVWCPKHYAIKPPFILTHFETVIVPGRSTVNSSGRQWCGV